MIIRGEDRGLKTIKAVAQAGDRAMVTIQLTEDELHEIWAVMENARISNFYGDPGNESWECSDRITFLLALTKIVTAKNGKLS